MSKPILNFEIGNQIIRKGFKYQESQVLTIDFIDYTREVYIFKEPWINSLTKFTSLNFSKVHDMFKIKE